MKHYQWKYSLPEWNGISHLHWTSPFLRALVACIISCTLIGGGQVFAQNKKELEQRRARILEEIQLTNKQLQQTTRTQKSEMQRLNILQEQVNKREELLKNIRKELTSVNTEIASNKKEVAKLESEVKNLMEEYSAILRKVYKIKLGTDPLMLLLSADNLNQAFQRWLYVNQIKKMRQAQAALIKEKQEFLQEKNRQLEIYRRERQTLLTQEEGQKAQISAELEEKGKLIQTLKQDEKQLRQQLKEKEQQQKKLQDEIQRIIALEIERQRKEAEAKARAEEEKRRKEALAAGKEAPSAEPEKSKPAVKPSLPVTPEVQKLSDDFGKNKGNLPWPVQKGTISRRFGTQAHAVISTLSVTNNGIDIRTEPNTPVRVVFKGKVLGKKFIPGHQYMVLVQHGKYYTIYSNLGTVQVKDGEEVEAGHVLGYSASSDEPTTEIHFEIWQEQQLQDPALWLKR